MDKLPSKQMFDLAKKLDALDGDAQDIILSMKVGWNTDPDYEDAKYISTKIAEASFWARSLAEDLKGNLV